MTRIEEGRLAFEFGERWNVFKLDDHRDYRQGIAKIENSKAVDFLGILNNSELYFIEVKDFRGYRIENRDRLLSGQLSLEIARKVKDSWPVLSGRFTDLTILNTGVRISDYSAPQTVNSKLFCGWKRTCPRHIPA